MRRSCDVSGPPSCSLCLFCLWYSWSRDVFPTSLRSLFPMRFLFLLLFYNSHCKECYVSVSWMLISQMKIESVWLSASVYLNNFLFQVSPCRPSVGDLTPKHLPSPKLKQSKSQLPVDSSLATFTAWILSFGGIAPKIA